MCICTFLSPDRYLFPCFGTKFFLSTCVFFYLAPQISITFFPLALPLPLHMFSTSPLPSLPRWGRIFRSQFACTLRSVLSFLRPSLSGIVFPRFHNSLLSCGTPPPSPQRAREFASFAIIASPALFSSPPQKEPLATDAAGPVDGIVVFRRRVFFVLISRL